MDNDRTPDHFLNGISLIIKNAERISLIAEKGRHVSGMFGMQRVSGVIMQPRVAEIIAAVSRIVYMHRIKIAGSGLADVRQSENLRLHQHAAVRSVIELDCTT